MFAVTPLIQVGRPLSELRERARAHPYLLDLLLVLGAFALVLVGAVTEPHGEDGQPKFGERELTPETPLLAALACGVLVLRRRAPMQVLCASCLTTMVGLALPPNGGSPSDPRAAMVLAAVIGLYTVSNRTDRSTSWRVGAVTVPLLTATAMLFGAQPWYAQENLGIFAWMGLAAALGEALRSRRAAVDAIRERAERAERTREEEARRRVAEERLRIARELHDVVAHHIALVNVQAGVASHVLDRRPDQAKQALSHVREASRGALDELQTTVGVLRQSGESAAPTQPTPGLEVLDELLEGFVRTGLAVTLESRPEGPPLPSAVDLTAYRVVQEALTNVQKHAGRGARAQVHLGRQRETLEIVVVDDGAGAARAAGAPRPSGQSPRPPRQSSGAGEPSGAGGTAGGAEGSADGGHGLLGMRERASALGGECTAGPLPGGGFRVRVRLPLQASGRQKEMPA